MNITNEIIQIHNDVKNYWLSLKNNPSYNATTWSKGFAVAYSPISHAPDFMIIGDNPGGGEKDFNPDEPPIPSEHDYFAHQGTNNDYKLAIAMREIFKNAHLESQLKASFKTNRIFIRTSNLNEFNHQIISREIESFCFDCLMKIIKTIRPKIIFAESIGTYDILEKIINKFEPTPSKRYPIRKEIKIKGKVHHRYYQSCFFSGEIAKGLIGVRHLTGSRTCGLYNEDKPLKEKIAQFLQEDYHYILQKRR